MPNRLAAASSPYLLQHQHNPVDWFPWCDEAFRSAREGDKPIFLSVGYSACHWCHVMERESFENADIAELLNRDFISIKVDREERPDVDQIYMQAVQMLTGSGGWPMSVFLDHERRPFYGGTYWPPESKWGRPGFSQVLTAVAGAWRTKRVDLLDQAEQLSANIASSGNSQRGDLLRLDPEWVSHAEDWLVRNHDPRHGGFGGAPKFPHCMDIALLVQRSASRRFEALAPHPERDAAAKTTLTKMALGGIYDHLGGGFARYSVDAEWLVPHFEKMLYDNGLLASVYADAYMLWRDPLYLGRTTETLDYVLRDMVSMEGGFFSAEDADSEGVEGKFYTWKLDELQSVLETGDAELFCSVYGVSERGNFEGSNILHLRAPLSQIAATHDSTADVFEEKMKSLRSHILKVRSKRVRPGLDDKVILGWHALMLVGFVRGYRASAYARYLAAAEQGVAFACENLQKSNGRYHRTWRGGKAQLEAYLDDYAYFLEALVQVFQVAPKAEYLHRAVQIADLLLEEFQDSSEGGFFFTSRFHECLIARNKDLADSSIPSGNATAAAALITLSRLTGQKQYLEAAQRALQAAAGLMQQSPQAAGKALCALDWLSSESIEMVLVLGSDTDSSHNTALRRRIEANWLPNCLSLVVDANDAQGLAQSCVLLQNRHAVGNKTSLYVCRNEVCQLPMDVQTADRFLDGILRAPRE